MFLPVMQGCTQYLVWQARDSASRLSLFLWKPGMEVKRCPAKLATSYSACGAEGVPQSSQCVMAWAVVRLRFPWSLRIPVAGEKKNHKFNSSITCFLCGESCIQTLTTLKQNHPCFYRHCMVKHQWLHKLKHFFLFVFHFLHKMSCSGSGLDVPEARSICLVVI